MKWIVYSVTGERANDDSTLYDGKVTMPVKTVGYVQTSLPMLLTSYQRIVLTTDLRVEGNSSYWGEL